MNIFLQKTSAQVALKLMNFFTCHRRQLDYGFEYFGYLYGGCFILSFNGVMEKITDLTSFLFLL